MDAFQAMTKLIGKGGDVIAQQEALLGLQREEISRLTSELAAAKAVTITASDDQDNPLIASAGRMQQLDAAFAPPAAGKTTPPAEPARDPDLDSGNPLLRSAARDAASMKGSPGWHAQGKNW